MAARCASISRSRISVFLARSTNGSDAGSVLRGRAIGTFFQLSGSDEGAIITSAVAHASKGSRIISTMYPTFFRVGSFEVTSFGVMVALGALIGLWVFGRELARSGLPASAGDAAMAGVFGGLLGAKMLWVAEHLGQEPFRDLILSRGGMSWFGGLVGGIVTALLVMGRMRLPIVPTLAASTPALAIGHAIGRIGCFLVGDDYGRPTNLPWAVAFPRGLPPTDIPVHPTQLYEMAALFMVAWLLIIWRRRGVADAIVLGRYLVLTGAIRFAIEFVRVNARILGPFTLAHLVSLALMIVGAAVLVTGSQRARVVD
jgi:phosphatidylglycerol---prolipoprotein diacylglyceryl transferase